MSDSLQPHWTVARQAPLSIGFSRQEYWSGLPCPSPGDLPDPGIEPVSPEAPALQADSLLLSHQGSQYICICTCICICTYICTYTCVGENGYSIHHSPETITILLISYILIENKKVQINRKKKKRKKTRIQLLKKSLFWFLLSKPPTSASYWYN